MYSRRDIRNSLRAILAITAPLLVVASSLSVASCEKQAQMLDVASLRIGNNNAAQDLASPVIKTRSPLVVAPGDRVSLTGTGFAAETRATVNGAPAEMSVLSETEAMLIAPTGVSPGLATLSLASGTGSPSTASLIYKGADTDLPVITLPPEDVCSGTAYYDADGNRQDGTRVCSNVVVNDCSSDGQTDCRATADYVAAKVANFVDSDIRSGVQVAGITGTLTEAPASCAADGATGCIANAGYPAATASGLASKVLSGETVAGVTGNVTLPSPSTVLSGTVYGVSGTGSTGTLTLPIASNVSVVNGAYGVGGGATSPTLALCGTNGSQSCVVQGTFFAATTCGANTSGCYVPAYAAGSQPLKAISYDEIDVGKSKIRDSLTLAGVTGTLADCADGGSGCVAVGPTYGAAVLSGLADKVLSGQTVAGVSGNVVLAAGNIKSGVTIGGVLGQYPSATYPLTGGTATNDLTSGFFNSYVGGSGSFEWFDSAGNRHVRTGENIQSSDFRSIVSILGTNGTMSECGVDGASGCYLNAYDGVTRTLKAADINGVNTWDIRYPKILGGITGTATHLRDGYDTATTSFTAVDYSTRTISAVNISSYVITTSTAHNLVVGEKVRFSGTLPTPLAVGTVYYVVSVPTTTSFTVSTSYGGAAVQVSTADTGGLVAKISNMTFDNQNVAVTLGSAYVNQASPDGNWTDVTPGGCTPSACVYRDNATGLKWSRSPNSMMGMVQAEAYCDALSTGGLSSGWRLASLRDVAHAFASGIIVPMRNGYFNNGYNCFNYVVTSTTSSTNTANAWRIQPCTSVAMTSTKGSNSYFLCVHE